ncbi:hypothetical protein C8R45DRAFT_173795 [Mycena sanguinolenta]|nr:hypothetical protein C8R45DRAFT_173795 [Mycena sanguinolenta]
MKIDMDMRLSCSCAWHATPPRITSSWAIRACATTRARCALSTLRHPRARPSSAIRAVLARLRRADQITIGRGHPSHAPRCVSRSASSSSSGPWPCQYRASSAQRPCSCDARNRLPFDSPPIVSTSRGALSPCRPKENIDQLAGGGLGGGAMGVLAESCSIPIANGMEYWLAHIPLFERTVRVRRPASAGY